jgi:squalene-hopene/tetraprenyl-beta-curcumene cyclase
MNRHPTIVAIVLACATFASAQTAPPTPAAPVDPAAKAQHLIDAGLAYLRSQQQPDGSWQLTDRDPPALTAIILKGFVQSPNYSTNDDFVRKGYDKLLSYQLETGGIYKDALASYNTAISISSLTAAKDPKFQPAIDKAVAYLKKLQWAGDTQAEDNRFDKTWEGGWGYGGRSRGGGRPDLSNAQLALDALKDAGLPPEDPAYKNAIAFVTRLQNRSASNAASWATNDGGFIYGPSGDGQGESMAGQYTTEAGDRKLRSYGSMTYAGLKSFIYAGLTKDDPRVKAAFDWIANNFTLDENPGMAAAGPDMARYGLFYYYMTLSRALNAFDEPTLTALPSQQPHDWRVELIDKLAGMQNTDGSWIGEKRWYEDNPRLATAYAVISLQEALADLKEHPAAPRP